MAAFADRAHVNDNYVVQELTGDVSRFEARFPPRHGLRSPGADPLPVFRWADLERQLRDLCATDADRQMVEHLVSATRKQARGKPPEMVLREVLILASVLADESFNPGG